MKKTLLEKLRKSGLTIATAESCTGGLIAKQITDISGASDIFECGIVAYSNRIKHEILAVPQDILDKFGAVSEQTAIALAKGVALYAKADIGIGVTGIAGPTGATPDKPVGLIYFSVYLAKTDTCTVTELRLSGTRAQNRRETARRVFEEIDRITE